MILVSFLTQCAIYTSLFNKKMLTQQNLLRPKFDSLKFTKNKFNYAITKYIQLSYLMI